MSLETNLASVRRRIAQACARSGRDPASVTLVCVTKGFGAETVGEALAAGAGDLGENRVQEARAKKDALGSRLKAAGADIEPSASSLQPVRWHLLGHLQRNKAKLAVDLFDAIHSVDSAALIEELERHAAERGKTLDAFLQVNVSGEAAKSGCRPEEVHALAASMKRAAHLRLAGLMTMAPFSDDPQASRPHFQCLRQLRDDLQEAGDLASGACHLSMGMSQDFEVAIEEGADIVRVGTAICGVRAQ